MRQATSPKTSAGYSPPWALGVRFNSTHASRSNPKTKVQSLVGQALKDKPTYRSIGASCILLIAKNSKSTPIDSRSMTPVEFCEGARASRPCFCDQPAFVDRCGLGHVDFRA